MSIYIDIRKPYCINIGVNIGIYINVDCLFIDYSYIFDKI